MKILAALTPVDETLNWISFRRLSVGMNSLEFWQVNDPSTGSTYLRRKYRLLAVEEHTFIEVPDSLQKFAPNHETGSANFFSVPCER